MKPLVGVITGPGKYAPPAVGGPIPQLAPVANRPLIAHALDALHEAGVRRACVVAMRDDLARLRPALAERPAAERSVDVEFVAVRRPPDLAAALAAAAAVIDGASVLAHTGDALLGAGLAGAARRFAGGRAVAEVVVAPQRGEVGMVPLLERRLLKLAGTTVGGARATPLVMLAPELVAAVAAGRSCGEGSLASALERVVEQGGRLGVRAVDQFWRYDGTLDNLLEGNRFALELIGDRGSAPDGKDVRIQGRVAVDASAHIDSSTIRGPAIIGRGARIRDAYIGPYTCVASGATIEGAEIENSIVMAGATITYVGRRIEASIVGANAVVRRDFSLPNAHRLRLGDDAEICLA